MSEPVKKLIEKLKKEKIEQSDIDATITDSLINDLEDLIDRDKILTALENGGVDNWEWYDEALEEYRNGKE